MDTLKDYAVAIRADAHELTALAHDALNAMSGIDGLWDSEAVGAPECSLSDGVIGDLEQAKRDLNELRPLLVRLNARIGRAGELSCANESERNVIARAQAQRRV